ncbi:uncharacterized protein LOC111868059 [Cryptotermes secundus]|uniref:uncharacterized protein LOC111868059 n=1 Tax=Cryptotermes secundus TaxID=105785 RepID=UPI000CD7B455|nr:uncharacterized protein LOC111868059 [Cryptotermes secundus]
MEWPRFVSLLGVLIIVTISDISGNPARSKITVDVKYEIICDEDFGDIGDSKNCTQNSNVNPQTEAPVIAANDTTVSETTVDPTTGDSIGPETTPTEETTSEPTTAGPFTCPDTGGYADPEDCHSYYRCDTISNPQHSTCIILTKFDAAKSGCSFGFC